MPRFEVHDLPQLYTSPSAASLLSTLDLLTRTASSFSSQAGEATEESPNLVDENGLTRYLTSIISSSLHWIRDEDAREEIWASASARISERSGRSAMPTMLRTFKVANDVKIALREPSLTEDKLGLKTWTSSLLLARRLTTLRKHIPSDEFRVLELGAGTGLVGIAAACLWKAEVTLTDLPEIISNLQNNIDQNRDLIQSFGGLALNMSLDWSDIVHVPKSHDQRFPLVLAADPLYSPEHPRLLANTVVRWLRRTHDARFIVELPLRGGYDNERADLKARLKQAQLEVVIEGEEIGYDDWEGSDGQLADVKCWWAVWKFVDSGSG